MIITTDLGTFKAFRLQRTEMNTPRLEVIEAFELREAHERMSDRVSDQAGRWKVPMQSMAMSYGEQQKITLELRRRLIKQVAEQMRNIVASGTVEACYFAASPEINEQVLNEAGAQVRAKIEKNLTCNLTNLHKDELLQHFLEPEPGGARRIERPA